MNTNLYAHLCSKDTLGVSENLADYDSRMMQEVQNFNAENNTTHDPFNSFHDYLFEQIEKTK